MVRRSRWVSVVLLGLSCTLLLVRPALADNGDDEKKYSEGAVKPEDFKGPAPPESQRQVGDVHLDAGIKTGLSYGSYDVVPGSEGGKSIATAKGLEFKSHMVKSGSWWDPKKRDDETDQQFEERKKKLLEHEQGHMDLAEAKARDLNSKARDLKGTGDTPEAASKDLADKIQKLLDDGTAELDKENDQYDKDSEHSTNDTGQKDWEKKIKDKLRRHQPRGPQAKSQSEGSLQFDATSGALTLDDDYIFGLTTSGDWPEPAPASDPMIGAAVEFPSFEHRGSTSWGDPLFSALGDTPMLRITYDETVFVEAELGYMTYRMDSGEFVGVMTRPTTYAETGSWFPEQVEEAYETSDKFPLGIHFVVRVTPEVDLWNATNGLTESYVCDFDNGVGTDAVTPEIEPGFLLALSMGLIAWTQRRRRKSLVSV